MTSEVGKLSPGPWTIETAFAGGEIWGISDAEGYNLFEAAHATDADVYAARAAPALLEALEGMLEEFNEQTITGIVHDELAKIAKARQAIALARGEES